MKAIVTTRYGSPETLQLTEVAKPTPKDNEVLVKVHAAAVNPLDWHFMRGSPFFMRFMLGLFKPRTPILGADFAGRIEAVGKDVTLFRPGDEVFGDLSGGNLGAFAEYLCVSEDASIVLKPSNISFEQAAAVPVAAITALQSIRAAKLKAGQTVLINGASGGVGTFTVQLAKYSGANVTAVSSGRNLELVRSIGADHVIDYTQEDFSRNGRQYDVIIDNIGNRSVADYRRALKPHGICVIIGFTTAAGLFGHMIRGAWASKTGNKQIGVMGSANSNKPDLNTLKELLESGRIVPVIDRCYPLSETASAVAYVESSRARGKVVITVTPSSDKQRQNDQKAEPFKVMDKEPSR
jgi:2-desacetyl-2-hydroxyethyl bacteriochlorophyllide A dehydrogenase